MNYFFKKNSFFATLFVFVIIELIYINPFNLQIFDPLKISLTDFSFNDLAFSDEHLSNFKDERIVIINIDTIGRASISKLIRRVSRYRPTVIGLDVLLPLKADSANSELALAIRADRKIVLAEKVIPTDGRKQMSIAGNQFLDNNHFAGFVNFRAVENSVVRYFPPFLFPDSNKYESFACSVVRVANSGAYKKVISRNNLNEWINYKRAYQGYYIINYIDILNDNVDSSFFRDKIILVGFVSPYTNNVEDKHYTPLNNKLVGRSLPDMNGVVIHANIISMILDGNYITRVPLWFIFSSAFFITWLYLSVFIEDDCDTKKSYHIEARAVQMLLLTGFLLYFSIGILKVFSVSIDFTILLISMITSADILFLYKRLLSWIQKEYFPLKHR